LKKSILLYTLLFFFIAPSSQGETLVLSPGLGGTLSLGNSSSGSHAYNIGYGLTGEIQAEVKIYDNYSLNFLYGYSFAFASMNAADIIHSAILLGYEFNFFMFQKLSIGYSVGSSFDYKGAKEPYKKGAGPVIIIANDITSNLTLNVQFHMISFPEEKLTKTITPKNNQIIVTFNQNFEIF